MKLRAKGLLRLISVTIAAALLAACLPCVALASSFSAVVTADSMVVAGDPRGKTVLGALEKNTVVTVTAYKKGVAQIEYNGKTGYAKASNMKSVESVASGSKKAVTAVATRIYKKANGKGASKKLKAGTGLYVLATKNGVSMVEKDGAVGYVKRKHLILEGDTPSQSEDEGGMTREQLEKLKKMLEEQQKKAQGDKESDKMESMKDAFTSGKYSNEQLCYLFLTKVMGYNTAAAAGVLANINYESGFKTTCVGDGGTSLGICQWHAGRKTKMINYCKELGVSSDSLAGQLAYLKYDLEHNYTKVNSYLKGVSNTAQGAYDAAYYFCYNFEAPASRTSQSTKRGNSAKNTYFPRYAKA